MLEEELGRMAPDLGVIEEWKRKDASYTQRLADLETATAARNEVLGTPTFAARWT
jgi:structural maintenance of chromosome 4